MTELRWPCNGGLAALPPRTSHNRTVSSEPPKATVRPSGLNATLRTAPTSASMGAPCGRPSGTLHSRTVPSKLAEASVSPSGLKERPQTSFVWPTKRLAERLSALGIPQPQRAVEVGGGERAPVRAVGDRPDAVGAAAQDRLRPRAPSDLERLDHRARRFGARARPKRLEPEEERPLDVVVHVLARRRCESERCRRPRRAPSLASLHQSPDAQRREHGHERDQHAADPREPTDSRPAPCLLLVVATPLEDRFGEDVVEELVAGIAVARRWRRGSAAGCDRSRHGRACRARR